MQQDWKWAGCHSQQMRVWRVSRAKKRQGFGTVLGRHIPVVHPHRHPSLLKTLGCSIGGRHILGKDKRATPPRFDIRILGHRRLQTSKE